MTNKITKREMFQMLDSLVLASDHENKVEMHDFITNEVELLDKKATKAKEAKENGENLAIMLNIIDVLEETGKPMTIADLMEDSRLATYEVKTKTDIEIRKMTNQKLSSIVKKLKDNGSVIRTEEKKKAYFSLPAKTEEETEATETE